MDQDPVTIVRQLVEQNISAVNSNLLLKKWKTEGKIRMDIDDELLPAFFDTLAHIDSHKEEIGIHHFPQVIQNLAEFIMTGLTDCQK
ncbi:hypothetical protein ABEV00_07930 [Paenibacillus thiaminolyticus]|uniref:hypothetical protein n=1 Tax=Paenibacillus thiaminolyticus TaxID=49283 RepID=UPI003D28AACF